MLKIQIKPYIIHALYIPYIIHTLHYVTYFNNECKNLVTSLRAHVDVVSPAVNTTPFEERSQQGRAVRNTVSDLIFPRFEPQTSRSRDEPNVAA